MQQQAYLGLRLSRDNTIIKDCNGYFVSDNNTIDNICQEYGFSKTKLMRAFKQNNNYLKMIHGGF